MLSRQWMYTFVFTVVLSSTQGPCSRPVLLIEDGHGSHIWLDIIKMARENDVHVLCLPSHCTRLLQPPRYRVFKSLKSHLNKMCKHFMASQPGHIITNENLAYCRPPCFEYYGWIQEMWDPPSRALCLHEVPGEDSHNPSSNSTLGSDVTQVARPLQDSSSCCSQYRDCLH